MHHSVLSITQDTSVVTLIFGKSPSVEEGDDIAKINIRGLQFSQRVGELSE